MKNYFNKNTIIALIVICFAIIASAFILYIQQNTKLVSGPRLDPFGHPWPIPSPPRQDEWKKTAVYHNEKYGYTLVYPLLYLSVETTVPEKVYFIESEDIPGPMAIEVQSTQYSKPEQELDAKNKKYHQNDFLEKRIKIAGYDAIVTYPTSVLGTTTVETFPNEKTTLFIKDHYLYKIITSYIDHERIWNSFKFE